MIEIEVQKNKHAYNVYHLVKAFFPGEEVVQKINGKQETLAAIRMPEGSCFSIAPEDTAERIFLREAAAGLSVQ